MDSPKYVWVKELANAWSLNHQTNVCIVDWTEYAKPFYLEVALRNILYISKHLTTFLEYLENCEGISYDNIILAGHSLGAHIAGLVGANLKSRLHMIIGMDVAGPLFTVPFIESHEKRLDLTDAQHVVAIHSSDGMAGANMRIGHQDFYINDGRFPQKGCPWSAMFQPNGMDPFRCAHFRAISIFQSSLSIHDNRCIGNLCDNFRQYQMGQCTGVTDFLGIKSKR